MRRRGALIKLPPRISYIYIYALNATPRQTSNINESAMCPPILRFRSTIKFRYSTAHVSDEISSISRDQDRNVKRLKLNDHRIVSANDNTRRKLSQRFTDKTIFPRGADGIIIAIYDKTMAPECNKKIAFQESRGYTLIR